MKQTEIGLIPDDWEVKTLGDVATFLDSKRIPITESERKKGIYPYYGASGIIDYVNNYIFDGDYVLLGEDGANIVDRNSRLAFVVHGKCWINNHAHVLHPNEDMDLDFLSEYLESLDYTSYNTGTAQPKLNREKCNSIPVIKPPLTEQQRIAKALSDVDALIATTEKLIQKKKNIKQGTMQNLLTGKKRLPEFAKSTNYKQTELGLIPEDWEVKALSDVIQNVKIKQIIKEPLVCGDFPVIQQGNIPIAGYSSGEPFIDYKNAIIFGDHTLSLFKPKKPFFVSSDGLKVLLINKGNPEYFYYLMNMYMPESEGYKRHFSIIKQILVPVTNNILEQTAIANVFSYMDKEIETLNTKLEKYRNLKTAMMQQLLTGKIRLR